MRKISQWLLLLMKKSAAFTYIVRPIHSNSRGVKNVFAYLTFISKQHDRHVTLTGRISLSVRRYGKKKIWWTFLLVSGWSSTFNRSTAWLRKRWDKSWRSSDYSAVGSFQTLVQRITLPNHVISGGFLVPAEEKLNNRRKERTDRKTRKSRMLTLEETGNASVTLWPAKWM